MYELNDIASGDEKLVSHQKKQSQQSRRHFSAAERAALRQEFWQAPTEALLSRAITAAGIGYSIGWLEWAATHGGGPVMTKLGRTVRYRKADVLAWIETHSERLARTGAPVSSSVPALISHRED